MAYQFKTTSERSSLMSKIRSSNTKPEIKLRKKLWGSGIRFCRNKVDLPGNPDVVIKKHKVVLFVDGEFWHGYNWEKKKKTIKSNRSYWIPKIERNMSRDKSNVSLLRKKGWHVIRFWQGLIDKDLNKCISRVKKVINKQKLKNN